MSDIILEMPKSRVYVFTDEAGRITRIEGEYSLPDDLTGWTLIDEGEGDRYNLAQSNYLDKPLITQDGIYQYKLINSTLIERSKEEIATEREIKNFTRNQ
jgi:hypothetical protein